MSQAATIMNPLALGFYTVAEAARLIEAGSRRRIHGWLRGYPSRATGPLVERQFEPLNAKEEISFLDLMELRLIEALRESGVRARTIRKAIVEARRLYGEAKPFATDRILLRTDGKNIFVEEVLKKVAASENDRTLWNLVTRQYEHYELIEKSLEKGVTFDPETHRAKTWRPRPDTFPTIIIDPRIAYGKPVTPTHVPTDAAYELWKAEGKSMEAVADWFNVPLDEAVTAVNFQRQIIDKTEKLPLEQGERSP